MANAHQLIDCFNDTMHRIQTDPFLRAETMKSKADTVVYPVFWDNNQAAYFAKWLYFDSCDVEVVADTTFSAARKYLRNRNERERVAVLNFANPHYAGGGVEHGAMAQEECLCRSSNLYPCLFAPCAQAEYYQFHRNRADHLFTDRVVYTPDVVVFKDDQPVPQLLPREQWFQVDVLTCAAPYLGEPVHISPSDLKALFKSRIREICRVAMEHQVTTVVLGAFGCGAFRNPPELVARAFRDVLQEDLFRHSFSKVVLPLKVMEGPTIIIMCFPRCLGRSKDRNHIIR